jgi:hypothetical protein
MKEAISTIILFLNLTPLFAQWELINNGIGASGSPLFNSYELDILGTTIYAATREGVYKSYNNGDNWSLIKPGEYSTITIKNNDIYVGGYEWSASVSHDTGTTWQTLKYSSITYRSIFVKDTIILLGYGSTPGGGVFKSTNSGATWTSSAGIPSMTVSDIAELGTNIYAGVVKGSSTIGGVFKSTNYGTSFVNISPPTLTGVTALTIDNGIIYAGDQYTGKVYFSSDSGATWNSSLASQNNSAYGIRSIAILGNTIYAGSNRFIYISSNNGVTWSNSGADFVYGGFYGGTAYSIVFNNGYIFAGTAGTGIWRCSLSSISSIEEEKNKNSLITIFPNPTNTEFTISYKNIDEIIDFTIQITNSLGQLVYSSPLYRFSENITITLDTNPGMYYVTSKDKHGNTLAVKKLIVN